MTDIDEDDAAIDYKAWALDLCSLLDEIETAADCIEVAEVAALDDLLKFRFQIARNHGMTVTIVGVGEIGHG